MRNKKIIVLKIISILAIVFIHLPSQKISIPYGMGIVFTITERLSELDFSYDLYLSFLFVLGLCLIFFKSKWVNLGGYLSMTIPLIVFITNISSKRFGTLFWIPSLIYLSLLVVVLYMKFSKVNSLTDKESYFFDKKNNE